MAKKFATPTPKITTTGGSIGKIPPAKGPSTPFKPATPTAPKLPAGGSIGTPTRKTPGALPTLPRMPKKTPMSKLVKKIAHKNERRWD